MMAALIGVVGALLCAALLAVVLRAQRPELALCLSLAAGVLVAVALMRQIVPLLASLRRLLEAGGVSSAYLSVVLKAAGICFITQLTADTCRDAGETALAGKAELAGRVLMLLTAVPLLEDVLTLVTTLVNGQAVGG